MPELIAEIRDFLSDLRRAFPGLLSPRRSAARRARGRSGFERAQRERCRALLEGRLAHWSAAIGVRYNRVFVKGQRTLWGSCSTRGNLNFNWRLSLAPPEVFDYVVIHELVHLVHHDHSKRFWERVALYCPEYKERRRWLRENGGALGASVRPTCDPRPAAPAGDAWAPGPACPSATAART